MSASAAIGDNAPGESITISKSLSLSKLLLLFYHSLYACYALRDKPDYHANVSASRLYDRLSHHHYADI
jgi:hypothetical protein